MQYQKSLGVGILSALVGLAVYWIIDITGHIILDTSSSNVTTTNPCYFSNHDDVIPIDYKWLILPELFHELAFVIIKVKSLEFTVAQSPGRMRGFMIGLWYAAFRLSMLIGINLQYLFTKILSQPVRPSCLFYYFLVKIVILATVFIAYVVLSRRYELRVREREVNCYQAAEDYYMNVGEVEHVQGLATIPPDQLGLLFN